ncbi:MAG: Hsp20/alpha crystallin family protein [Bacteroidia bacterium]|nr:Hsp20/alpha crystallin family protein [Bacteroidia bacterium]
MRKNKMIVKNIKPRPTFLSDMLVSNFGELADSFFNEEFGNSTQGFKPAIEVKEKESQFEVKASLAGIKKEDISIEVEDNRLKISGVRSTSSEKEEDKVHMSEFRYGKFERVILLAKNANYDKIEAQFEDGILTIIVPKQEVLKPKNITIK